MRASCLQDAGRIAVLLAGMGASAFGADITRLEDSYRFLVSGRDQGGVLYTASAGELSGRALPLSFYDSAAYWGEHVCRLPSTACAVVDVYDPKDYTLQPQAGAAGDLQIERVNTHNGMNIYDAATWQIAVMLGRVVHGFALPAKQDAYALSKAPEVFLARHRATTRGAVFRYNGQAITEAQQAYAFRMLSAEWLATDPFVGTSYAASIRTTALPRANPEYQAGKISWTDWKPITGENAWAFLIGPLQAAYLQYVRSGKQAFVPFRESAVQNALALLPTFAAMQSPLGAVYYAPAGTASNQGRKLVNPYEVSAENNFSLYAGLRILEATLRDQLAHDSSLGKAERARIDAALRLMDAMINGGRLDKRSETQGLLAFFKNAAWRDGEFLQGGLANDPAQAGTWTPAAAKAVDVNTWGVAALGAKQIDAWFGFGAAYNVWQQVKRWGGYGVGRTLWGVGYSDQDGNGMDAAGDYRQGVLSAEWTAGAINMLRNMQEHYRSQSNATAHQYVEALAQDERAMLEAVQTLRWDRYRSTDFPGKPANYAALMTIATAPYLYASRRYAIPFGWYANPLPSTCATAWMIMLAARYDPFGYGGKVVNATAS